MSEEKANSIKDSLTQQANESWEKARREQEEFFTKFAETNIKYATAANQQAFLQTQVQHAYIQQPDMSDSFMDNAIPTFAGTMVGGATAFGVARATGSRMRGLKYGGLLGATLGIGTAGIMNADQPSQADIDNMMNIAQNSGAMNAYWTRANWSSMNNSIMDPDVFRNSFEIPLQEAAKFLGVSPSQAGPGIADIVSSGYVSGTGRDLKSVIGDATVLFKSLESFFGSVDINALKGKIGEMLSAGFTPETMFRVGSAMQNSIFAFAPQGMRDQITAMSIQAGGITADMGFSASVGAESLISNYGTAYNQFSKLSEYNQFKFRNPKNMAGVLQNAYNQYLNTDGFAGLYGGGDAFAGSLELNSRFDTTTPEGIRNLEQFKYEYSKNITGLNIREALVNKAKQLQDTLGVDFKTALTMSTGSEQAADAVLISMKDSKEKLEESYRSNILARGRTVTFGDLRNENRFASDYDRQNINNPFVSNALAQAERTRYTTVDELTESGISSATGGLFDPVAAVYGIRSSIRRMFGDSSDDAAFERGRPGGRMSASYFAGISQSNKGNAAMIEKAKPITDFLRYDTQLKSLIRRNLAQGKSMDGPLIVQLLRETGKADIADMIEGDPSLLGVAVEELRKEGVDEPFKLLNETVGAGFSVDSDSGTITMNENLFRAETGTTADIMTKTGAALASVGGITATTALISGGTTGIIGGALSVAGTALMGAGYLTDNFFDPSLNKEEATKLNNSLYGENLIVKTISSLIAQLKDVAGVVNKFSAFLGGESAEEMRQAALDLAKAIYLPIFTTIGGNKSKEERKKVKINLEQLYSAVSNALNQAASSGGDVSELIKAWVEKYGDSQGLRNSIMIIARWMREAESVMTLNSLFEALKNEQNGILDDILEPLGRGTVDEDALFNKLNSGKAGDIQSLSARSLTSKANIEKNNVQFKSFSKDISDKYDISSISGLYNIIIEEGNKSGVDEKTKMRNIEEKIRSRGVLGQSETSSVSEIIKSAVRAYNASVEGAKGSAEVTKGNQALADSIKFVLQQQEVRTEIQNLFNTLKLN